MGAAAGIAGGLGAVGSLIGGISGASAAKAQAKQARSNAALAANSANVALDEGDQAVQRQYQEGSQRLGAARAQMAANGVSLNSGSALAVQKAQALTTGQNVSATQYNALVNATNYRNQVVGFDNQAKLDKAQANQSLFGGILKAGTTALGTASQFAGKWSDLWGAQDFSGSGTGITPSYNPATFGAADANPFGGSGW